MSPASCELGCVNICYQGKRTVEVDEEMWRALGDMQTETVYVFHMLHPNFCSLKIRRAARIERNGIFLDICQTAAIQTHVYCFINVSGLTWLVINEVAHICLLSTEILP